MPSLRQARTWVARGAASAWAALRRFARTRAGRRSFTAALALLWMAVLLHTFLNSDAVHDRIIAEAKRRLPNDIAEVRLGRDFDVDWIGRVRLGPIEIASGPNAAPLVEIASVRVRPRYSALLLGRVEPASLSLNDVRVHAGPRGQALRDLVSRFRAAKARREPSAGTREGSAPRLIIDRLIVDAGAETLGPFAGVATLSRSPAGSLVEARVQLPDGGRAQLQLRAGGETTPALDLWFEEVSAATVPTSLSRRLPFKLERATASGHLHADAAVSYRFGRVSLSAQVKDLVFSGERLAAVPIGPAAVSCAAELRWDEGGRAFELEKLELGVGDGLRATFEGELKLGREPRIRLEGHADDIAYEQALRSLPPQLAPGEGAPRLDGTLSARAKLSGPLDRPAEWQVEAKLDLSKLRKAARAAPSYLAGPFAYRPAEQTGNERELWVGDRNPDFVPVDELPEYVVRAVTTSEDAGFFAHQGFDFAEMADSFQAAMQHKRLRGASTITQQLAKNLFLSRERTYARKVREALVTIALEAALPKARLMEIYLNIIEWGPDVYGIGEAAQHYFGADPRELSIKQAAFLASIIPNPIKYHVYFERGALSDTWDRRVEDLLIKMRAEGIISTEQYEAASATPLSFRRATGGARSQPMTGLPF